jgi:putative flippase GtrA
MVAMNKKLGEVFRFVLVGGIATGIHYGLYLLLNPYLNASIAYTIGYIISFLCNFVLSNYFTFRTRPNVKKGLGFAFSHLVNYTLHIVLLNVFLWIGLSKTWAPIPVFAIVIPVNFILVRFFLKNKRFENHEKGINSDSGI